MATADAGRRAALTSEMARLGRRTADHLRAGGLRRVGRQAVEKLGVYAAYQPRRLGRGGTFVVDGREHHYFRHPYNATWRNERSVEIPLARAFLHRHHGVGLEVGNVLSHYGPVGHTIVDRYEPAAGVVNVDVLDFSAPDGLDYVVTISTLEHVGWDDRPQDGHRAVEALDHLRSLLRPAGRLFVTCPVGHNPVLDERIFAGEPTPLIERFLRRSRKGNRFVEIDKDRAREVHVVAGRTTVLWVAEFGPFHPPDG
jgi:SAM-dependent methyltransferase